MLKTILFLALSATCCTGQRRWAGSYDTPDHTEERVTWDDRNYRHPDLQTSTDGPLKFDHRRKWPVDNREGQNARDVSTPYSPPIRRDEYDPRRDERPQRGRDDRRTPDTVDSRHPDRHLIPEDEYERRKVEAPSFENERQHYPKTVEDAGRNSQRGIHKDEETHSTRRQNTRNSEEEYIEPPEDHKQRKFSPASTENYDDSLRGNDRILGRERPKDVRVHDVVRGDYDNRDQPTMVTYHANRTKGYRSEYRPPSREEIDVSDYDGSVTVSKQNGGEGYDTSTHSKGDVGIVDESGTRTQEELLRDREYDRRKEEELKQKEYERRQEEMRRKNGERADTHGKELRYNIRAENRKQEVTGRDQTRREGPVLDDEYKGRQGQTMKGVVEIREPNIKGVEANRHQEERGDYDSGEEMKGRSFQRDIDFKESDSNGRKGMNEESSRREKGEERQQTTYNHRHEDESRNVNMKGHGSREDGETNRRNIYSTEEQVGTKQFESREKGSTERHIYDRRIESGAKGEPYNRETDHVVKRLNYGPRASSRDYSDSIQMRNRTGGNDGLYITSTGNEYRRIEDNNTRNRATEYPRIRETSEGSTMPKGNNDRKNVGERNRAASQQRNTGSQTTYHTNYEGTKGVNPKSIISPPYSESNDRHTRRTDSRRDEPVEQRTLHGTRTVVGTDDYRKPVHGDKNTTQISSSDKVPGLENQRKNNRKITNRNETNKDGSDNWKSTNGPPSIHGYHPNISYDTIVFPRDDDWTPDRKVKELRRDGEQDDHRRDYRGSSDNSRRNSTQQNRTSTRSKRENDRSSLGYLSEETDISIDTSSQMEDTDIYSDVEILPGYEAIIPEGQRNYNDEVIDDEVELFSSKEIRVDTRSYTTNSTNKGSAGHSQEIPGKKLQAEDFIANKETRSSGIVRNSDSEDEISRAGVKGSTASIKSGRSL